MSRKTAQVLIAGPAVVKRALHEDKTKEELGGAKVHTRNGVVDNIAKDEEDAFAQIRRFLDYMPQSVWELPERRSPDDDPNRQEEELLSLIPRDRRQIFDARKMIDMILDQGSFFEMARDFGRGQIIGLARMSGQPVGVLANDSRFYAGAMTAAGAQKVKRFVEICQTFHIPIISLVDEPGFMIGSESERLGAIRYGTATVLTVASCTVPWASVVVRKSYGVAQGAHYGPNAYVLAWPSAEMGALPVEGGVAVAFGRDIAAAEDPEARRLELEAQMAERTRPNARAESFSMHELIDPRETRPRLSQWIEWIQPLLPELVGPVSFPVRP